MPRKYTRKAKGKKPMSRWGIYKRAGTQLWKDVKMLKSIVNVEYKLKEVLGTTGTLTTGSPVVTCINGLTRGTDYNNITGRSCKFTSAQIFLKFSKNVNDNATKFSYALVIDKQANESSPTISDIWSDNDAQFRNLNNRKRFVIIHRGALICQYGQPEKQVSFYKKLDMHTIYDDTNGGGQADIRTNALYLMFWTDDSTGADQPSYTYSTRLRFIDN